MLAAGISLVAAAIVVLAGMYLLALGAAVFVLRVAAERFFLSFARTPSYHYLELAIRLAVGGSFVIQAPELLFPAVFRVVGWVLLGTTLALMCMPWRWHRQFAQRSVPRAIRYLPLVGAASLLFGAFIVAAVVLGGT